MAWRRRPEGRINQCGKTLYYYYYFWVAPSAFDRDGDDDEGTMMMMTRKTRIVFSGALSLASSPLPFATGEIFLEARQWRSDGDDDEELYGDHRLVFPF